MFKLLRERLAVGCECFASPLNASFARYGSAFADVDGPFGSAGSFFKWVAACACRWLPGTSWAARWHARLRSGSPPTPECGAAYLAHSPIRMPAPRTPRAGCSSSTGRTR